MAGIKKINKAEEIDNKVKAGTILLNSPEHKKAIQEVNEAMEAVRRDYQLKDSNSQASASTVVLRV
jgi:uncharacterized membrane protein YjjP (DUF1212 family)